MQDTSIEIGVPTCRTRNYFDRYYRPTRRESRGGKRYVNTFGTQNDYNL